MSWDALQREVLEAMGHVVYEHAASPAMGLPVPDHPLVTALLRAAGRQVSSIDAGALCKGWVPLERQRDPAAKRALWPHLRALRAQSASAGAIA